MQEKLENRLFQQEKIQSLKFFFQLKSILTWNCGGVKNFFPKKASGIDAGLNEEAHCHFMFICIHLQVNLQSTFD